MNPGIVGYGAEFKWAPSKISLFDFPDNINVLLEEQFRKKFIEEALKSNGSFRILAKNIINPKTQKQLYHSTVCRWYSGKNYTTTRKYQNYIPMWAIRKLYDLTDFNYTEIERNVVAYRGKSGLSVKNPVLPIVESPELFNIVGHLIADGCATPKPHSASYDNNELGLIQTFKENVRKVFGDIELSESTNKETIKVGVISPIRVILWKMFPEIQNKSAQNVVPNRIIFSPVAYKVAFLKAIMDDEGTVGYGKYSQLKVYSDSKLFLEQLKEMFHNIEIKTGVISISTRTVTPNYCFTILKESWEIYLNKIGFDHKLKRKELQKKALL
ncbi:MAG: hypothetical protein COV47_03745 [Candidatus Diapherotrites archaeon CG11_big_fil_rev_8_21_14_0_20_37_9]|nr:MAG: hypothetical protein COV47_03745 [Candidatus Diapherotrites archaeon CG11_big_fil_rev_8_21_14_0_20_37_9]